MSKTNPIVEGETPSAPPLESAPSEQPRETLVPLQGATGHNMPDLPPPTYQEAVNYPAAPPYPSYEPNNFPAAPHHPNQSISQNLYPIYPNYGNASGTGAPVHTVYVTPQSQGNPTTHIHHTTVVSSNGPIRLNSCPNCSGSVESETDVCCLLCLILLAIFTLPFGLILLFCIPCTIRKRCNRCRRLYD